MSRPGFWALLGGRFVIASIRLEGASINLAKSGPASEWGRWNFASLVNRSVMRAAPPSTSHTVPRQPHQFQVRRHEIGVLSHRNGSRHFASRFARRRLESLRFRQNGPHRPSRAGSRFLHREGALVRGARARRSGCGAGPHRAGRNHGAAARPGRQHTRHHLRRGCTWAVPSTISASWGGSRSKTCTAGTCCRPKARAGRSIFAAAWTWSRSNSSCSPTPPATRRCRCGCGSGPTTTSRSRTGRSP